MIKEFWNFTASWAALKLQKWKDFQRMWLFLVGACDICRHQELSESLNFTWWVVVGVFIQLSLWSGNESANSDWKQRGLCKTHSYLETTYSLVGRRWYCCESCRKEIWASLLGFVFGARTSYTGLQGGVFNKCSQHCFLHPVWSHFSPKSNQSLSSSLAYWLKCISCFRDVAKMRRIWVQRPQGGESKWMVMAVV